MKHLNKRAKEIYEETLQEFNSNKNCVDLNLIQAYAVELETYERACKEIAKSNEVTEAPSGYLMINPFYTIRKQSLKIVTDLAKQLQLTKLQEKQTTKISKLELLTNGKKIQNNKVG